MGDYGGCLIPLWGQTAQNPARGGTGASLRLHRCGCGSTAGGRTPSPGRDIPHAEPPPAEPHDGSPPPRAPPHPAAPAGAPRSLPAPFLLPAAGGRARTAPLPWPIAPKLAFPFPSPSAGISTALSSLPTQTIPASVTLSGLGLSRLISQCCRVGNEGARRAEGLCCPARVGSHVPLPGCTGGLNFSWKSYFLRYLLLVCFSFPAEA